MSENALDIRFGDLASAPKTQENREKGVLERKAAISAPHLEWWNPAAVELEARQKKERKEADDRHAAMKEIVLRLREIQDEIYKKLDILPKTEANSVSWKFKKGVVDVLVTDNLEFVRIMAEQGVEAVLRALATMLSSLENVKKLMSAAFDELKAKAEWLLDFDAYSLGKTLGGMGFWVLWMVRSSVREGVALGVKEAVQWAAHLATFKIPLGHPPVLTGTRIYECAELVSREMVMKWPEETKKLLDLIESSGEYLKKHGHETKALPNYERRQFESSLNLLVTNSIRVVSDPKIPAHVREAVSATLKDKLLPAYQSGHKIPHTVS